MRWKPPAARSASHNFANPSQPRKHLNSRSRRRRRRKRSYRNLSHLGQHDASGNPAERSPGDRRRDRRRSERREAEDAAGGGRPPPRRRRRGPAELRRHRRRHVDVLSVWTSVPDAWKPEGERRGRSRRARRLTLLLSPTLLPLSLSPVSGGESWVVVRRGRRRLLGGGGGEGGSERHVGKRKWVDGLWARRDGPLAWVTLRAAWPGGKGVVVWFDHFDYYYNCIYLYNKNKWICEKKDILLTSKL